MKLQRQFAYGKLALGARGCSVAMSQHSLSNAIVTNYVPTGQQVGFAQFFQEIEQTSRAPNYLLHSVFGHLLIIIIRLLVIITTVLDNLWLLVL